MMKLSWKILKHTPIILGMCIVLNSLTAQKANANEVDVTPSENNEVMWESINNYNDTQPMDQITSVSQLRDVSPTDWSYEALRSLVERYGCIVGYPDRTFRGNRALSRYEFAAGLNACMQQMERLIQESQAVLRDDIELLKRLMREFEVELATLGARVDNLEGRVAFLEDNQFSTTTKLKGEVIMAFTAGRGSEYKREERYPGIKNPNAPKADTQSTLSYRARLTLATSFTGKDYLKTRLAAGNITELHKAFGTDMARLNFQQNTDNDVMIDRVYYRTPLGDNATFWIGTDLPPEDIYDTMNPFLESSGSGAIARFNRYNPFVYRTTDGGGIGLNYEFSEMFDITASYIAGDADDPSQGNGLFNGLYSAGVQLGFRPADNLDFAVTYMHSYYPEGQVNLTGTTGSSYSDNVSQLISTTYLNADGSRKGGFNGAKDPFGGAATTSENVGIQGTWRVSEKFNVAAWGGWAGATAKSYDETGINRDGDYTDLWTWNANVSFIDLFTDGAVLTLAGGQLPRAGSVEGTFGRDRGQSWMVEGQYKYPVNDNISITPGIYAIFDPNNQKDNTTTILVGVLRTVFKF